MGNSGSELSEIQSPNSIQSDRAAGIVPCCLGKENGVGYVLLALQPVYPLSRDDCGGWNPLWGCHDETDIDMQHTAAREAEEEALGAVGTVNYIRELLLSPNNCCQIFEGGCFLAGYGTLDQEGRQWIVDYHRKKKLNVFNKFAWEVDRLEWIPVTELRDALFPNAEKLVSENLLVQGEESNHNASSTAPHKEKRAREKLPAWRQERIRPFFDAYLKKRVDWKSENSPLRMLMEVDSWTLWREGNWVSADGKTTK